MNLGRKEKKNKAILCLYLDNILQPQAETLWVVGSPLQASTDSP